MDEREAAENVALLGQIQRSNPNGLIKFKPEELDALSNQPERCRLCDHLNLFHGGGEFYCCNICDCSL